ncbi:MAG TPA: PD-(D/E)XK nuclease family protein, partial [Edaphobacter sp.]|nr:PD-(D/E)XK nuclease family protein [Edaphobacter sp.]
MGSTIDEFHGFALPESQLSLEAENEVQEILIAAQWAKTQLEKKPDARLGLIVPSLENRRNPIDRIFREVLAPELGDIRAPNDTAPHEFSVGTALSERPMVRVALDLIQWILEPLSTERVSFLLTSPLFAMREEERYARARVDAFDLRRSKMLLPTISITSLARVITRSKYKAQLSGLLETLDSVSRFSLKVTQGRNAYTAWADIIRELLKTARWGRSAGEDSLEFQTRRKWESLLDEMATLDFLGASVTFEDAFGELERLAEQTMFAPESHNAAVQVMGPLEAAGSNFDAIWFLGAGDLQWPIRKSLNPLLPRSLQRELHVPGADAAEDDVRAHRLVERILSSAPTVIFSYAVQTQNGKQHLSPILRPFHLEKTSVESIAPPIAETESVTLEEFSDIASLVSTRDEISPGGAEVLKLQAACGFRAFAERRLGSTELRRIELGMDPSERGNIVHRVLEHFWKTVRTQSNLKAMTSEDRNASLAQSINHVLGRVICTTPWEQAYVELQFARLKSLLAPWLELELQRSPFEVKFSEEETKDVHIGPLRLNLRVDRIDVTESGEVILDYKTGSAKSADWQGERPDEPQLPLYAVHANAGQSDARLTDIAFAHIRAGKDMSLEGYATKVTPEKQSLKRPSTPFEEQLIEWHRILEDLAIAFYRGEAYVDPKNYPTTCTHCAQRILCRLNTAAFDEDIDEETPVIPSNG